MRTPHLMVVLAACAALAPVARAQGSLSGQGFGYPPGQLGTRAAGTAGGVAEFDPVSPINPAALASWGATGLFFEYEPEFRRVESGSERSRLSLSRFPLLAAGIPVGRGVTIGLSVSTLLDRTFVTTTDMPAVGTGPDSLPPSVERFSSNGAINDLRLAGAWSIRRIRLGVGLHALTGEHRVQYSRAFDDTTGAFLAADFRRNVSYGGTALSVGAEWRVSSTFAMAASGRRGGTISAESGDTTLSSSGVPDRFGASLRYDGLSGTSLAARAAWDGWSSLGNLGSSRAQASDAWDLSLGADVAGPRLGRRVLMLRTGVRWRTLPFKADGHTVEELSLAAGAGTMIARDRATIDVSVQRAMRDAPVGAKENGWLVGIGLSVRP